MAIAAVGATVAVAGAAAAAAQAAKSGKGGPGSRVSVPEFTPKERRMQEQTRQLLGESRGVVESGVGTQAMLEPELLRALGFDVQVQDRSGDIAEQSAAVQATQDNVLAIQRRIAEIKAGLQATKASGRRVAKGGGARKALKQERKQLKKDQAAAKNELERLQAELGQLRTNPYTITGITRTPTEAEQQQAEIETELGSRALAALSGELPDNPRLLRELDQQEGILRQRLARDLGADFEATTIGAAQLRDFEQRREEILEADRLATIQHLIPLQSNLSDAILGRTTTRQQAASQVARERLLGGEALSAIARDFVAAQQPFQSLRGEKQAAQAFNAQQRAAEKARRDAALQQAFGSLTRAGGGLLSYGAMGGSSGDSTSSSAPNSNVSSSS